jgi:hypothetical protein
VSKKGKGAAAFPGCRRQDPLTPVAATYNGISGWIKALEKWLQGFEPPDQRGCCLTGKILPAKNRSDR